MDIQMRFNKEMLAVSSDVDFAMQKMGITSQKDLCMASILDADSLNTIYSHQIAAGAQCLVANTKYLLKSQLAHFNLEDKIEYLASAALKIANQGNPQHVLVELGHTGLPLDDMSRQSLLENKNQYVDSARIFENLSKNSTTGFDAYYLSGLQDTTILKCALMGLRQVTDKPIFACVSADEDGRINSAEDIYDATQVMVEFGTSVVGVSTDKDSHTAMKLLKRMRAACDLPLLIEFICTEDNSFFYPDTMKEACAYAHKGGAQFVRASGYATPAYTAVLSAFASELSKNQ